MALRFVDGFDHYTFTSGALGKWDVVGSTGGSTGMFTGRFGGNCIQQAIGLKIPVSDARRIP